MKKLSLLLLSLLLLAMLSGCATISNDNSFQSQAPDSLASPTAETQALPESEILQINPQSTDTQLPAPDNSVPTQDPDLPGYNG